MSSPVKEKFSKKDKSKLTNFFFREDMVYTCSGESRNDMMTVWEEGGKVRKRKHFLNMFLWEAHAVFNGENPDATISYANFCKHPPENVLLMKFSPTDNLQMSSAREFILCVTVIGNSLHQQHLGQTALRRNTQIQIVGREYVVCVARGS